MRPLAILMTIAIAACAQVPAEPPASAPAAAEPASAAPAAQPEKVQPPTTSRGVSSVKGAQSTTAGAPANYHVIERNGVKYYCTDKPELGTRIKSRTTCLTEEQYQLAKQGIQDKMREKQGQQQTFQ